MGGNKQQESIPVGCILPACQPYVFWWPPLDVRTGEGVGPQENKFEPLSSDDHHMPVAGEKVRCLVSGGRVGPNASWVMVTWGPQPPLNRMRDTCENITFPQLRWRAVKIDLLIEILMKETVTFECTAKSP